MKITAVTQDQLIVLDGVPAFIASIGGYQMQRGEWAVHFDTEMGIGHIEYIDSRQNQSLTTELFNAHYAWLVAKHEEFIQWKSEQDALEQAQAELVPEINNPVGV